MRLTSCIYEGHLVHVRRHPIRHMFRVPLYLMYIDLEEINHAFGKHPLWSGSGPNVAWFRRADYHGDPHVALCDAVADSVEASIGTRPGGPIRVLTQLRHFGYVFNPVSFYFAMAREETHIEALVAEVTNTPWGERHTYVLPLHRETDGNTSPRFRKALHVSPFFGMTMSYRISTTLPADQLTISMQADENERTVFDASLELKRKEITVTSLTRLLLRYPFISMQVVGAIYYQALRLRLKGAPFHPHPASPSSKPTLSSQDHDPTGPGTHPEN